MSQVLIDYMYVNQMSNRLDGFTRQRDRLWVCRCPMCGDSGKSKKKKRFYIFQNSKGGVSDHLSVSCHNCGYGNPFGKFLEEFDAQLYQEYRLDLFREMGWGTTKQIAEPKWEEPAPVAVATPKRDGVDLPTVGELHDTHFARVYLQGRRMPTWAYDYLLYTNNFARDFKGFSVESELMYLPEDARIVIPFYDEWGGLEAIQGRSLGDSKLRYITLKKDPSSKKVFGLDRLDKSRVVLVVEGPFDSMFLPNCIATADADLLSASIGDIFIPDNQYRNREICNRIEKMIDAGKKVVLFPEGFPYKDINDAIIAGLEPRDIIKIIATRTFSGLKAKMVFSQLRKDVRYVEKRMGGSSKFGKPED